MAQDPKYHNVQFVSICCDKLDEAREIIEREDKLRWTHLEHYFMEFEYKEQAKQILGFSSVPFYVVLTKDGLITQKCNKVNLDDVPGILRPMPIKEKEPQSPTSVQQPVSQSFQHIFELDDLDF
jgi:hypothetical protein